MSASNLKKAVCALSGAFLLLASGTALAEWNLNMSPGVTPVSHQIYDLHMLILWIVTVVGVGVFGVMIFSIIKHRKSKGVQAAGFHENTTLEIVWTVIPFLILVGIAIPATKTLLAIEDTSDADLTIKVTGYQWKWKYDYLDEGISFFSSLSTPREQIEGGAAKGEHYLLEVDNPLVVPVNQKIRILTTSNDVIHAWWVPVFAVKRDAIPGFINESWARIERPGVYRGQCAELCGKDHGFMPIVVIAKTAEEYRQWVAQQKAAKVVEAKSAEKTWAMEDLMARGENVYNTSCASCHMANGEGLAGVFPPIKGGVISTGPVDDHIRIVVYGKPGTAMQAFGAQLSDVDLAAVITYERNAWGNDTGDVVQPSQVKAAHAKNVSEDKQ